MRFIAITILALACAACSGPGINPAPLPDSTTTPPGVVSHAVTFTVQGLPGLAVTFSDVSSTITIDTYTRQVTAPINIVATPPAGTAVSEWIGADWSSGPNATVLPGNIARTVTIVIAPSAGG